MCVYDTIYSFLTAFLGASDDLAQIRKMPDAQRLQYLSTDPLPNRAFLIIFQLLILPQVLTQLDWDTSVDKKIETQPFRSVKNIISELMTKGI